MELISTALSGRAKVVSRRLDAEEDKLRCESQRRLPFVTGWGSRCGRAARQDPAVADRVSARAGLLAQQVVGAQFAIGALEIGDEVLQHVAKIFGRLRAEPDHEARAQHRRLRRPFARSTSETTRCRPEPPRSRSPTD
jgi:hypothetical protein